MYEPVRYYPVPPATTLRLESSRMPSRAATAPLERTRDRERTRAEILAVATREFAEHGYSGARVDEIAERTRTTKRMLYYYFESKQGLFAAVLEAAYAEIRRKEQTIEVDHLDPVAAIRCVAELTFDHHESHPDFIRLVAIENIHRAEHISAIRDVQPLGSPAIELIDAILSRGRAAGVFTRRVDALDVHMLISAYCVFRIANRYTFRTLFERDLVDPARRDGYRRMLGDLVVGYLTA
jgi:AcrR family transcriptional regulator